MTRTYFILNKCLHYLLALQVLNMSFGNLVMADHVFTQPGIEINEIDSALEFITENLLGWDNYVPEKNKAHQDNHFIKANTCFLFCERYIADPECLAHSSTMAQCIFVPGLLAEYSREINPPPPKPVVAGFQVLAA